jgi:hypothetical protein
MRMVPLGLTVLGKGMKKIDPRDVTVVHSGDIWPHAQLPCSRQMIRFLERNEDVVTWVQVHPISLPYIFGKDLILHCSSLSLGTSRTSFQ